MHTMSIIRALQIADEAIVALMEDHEDIVEHPRRWPKELRDADAARDVLAELVRHYEDLREKIGNTSE